MSAEFIITRKTVLGLVAAGLLGSTVLASSMLLPSIPVQAGTQAIVDPTKSFAPLVEQVMPSVVSVEVKFAPAASSGDDADTPEIPRQFHEFFEQFPQFRDRFQGRPDRPDRNRGMAQGSGFLISADGYVVTNNHVVKDASEVKLRFQSGDEYDATVIGLDAKTDLALLKIKSDKTFAYVPFADNEAKVGDWVMAVGNPFGLGGTVTAGIISARGRDIGSGPYDDYLQVDASINRGNSGGPAFNLMGEVVGVNTAIFSPSGGSVGIGFAIPTAVVKDVIESLKTNGAVTRGWLGVQIQPVTEELAEGLGLDTAKGAIISDVTEQSPAVKAGLKQGDTILKANGEDIDDARDLAKTIARIAPGKSIPIEIIRDGKIQTISVAIGAMPGETPKMAGKSKRESGSDLTDLGLEVMPADDGAGVKIIGIDPNSPAAERGLQKGDIILEVAGMTVNSPSDVSDALEDEKGKRVLMLVRSAQGQRYIALPREKS